MNYQAVRDKVAAPAIKKYGAPMTLRRSSGGTLDPVAGTVGTPTEAEYPCYGLIVNIDTKIRAQFSPAAIEQATSAVLLSAGDNMPRPASTTDTLEIAGIVHKVIDCKPLSPATVDILYTVLVTA